MLTVSKASKQASKQAKQASEASAFAGVKLFSMMAGFEVLTAVGHNAV
jgi:hypothetical protein